MHSFIYSTVNVTNVQAMFHQF